MACVTCREDWGAQLSNDRAVTFDVSHPECECEGVPVSEHGPPINDGDLLARLIVSPLDWKAGQSELVWIKIRAAWRAGLSFFRPGTSVDELRQRVDALTQGGPEVQTLVGAVLTTGGRIRATAAESLRTYCVYDTDAPEFSAHADAIGRGTLIPTRVSRSKTDAFTEKASRALRVELERKIVPGGTADELVDALRVEGFVFAD